MSIKIKGRKMIHRSAKSLPFAGAGCVMVAVAIASLAGCGKSDSDQGTQHSTALAPVPGGVVTWGVGLEPACFDPHRSSQQNAFWVIRNYVDSLIYKQRDGTYAPWLAKAWSVSDDGKTYTFQLREDVHFTDGTTFDAQSVKANFDYIVENVATTASSAALLVHLDHVDVVSPHEVRIVLKQADSTVLASLSSVSLGFISPKALASNHDLCAGGQGIVGTGPFVFSAYQRGQSVTFTRNPDYRWAPAAQHQGPAWLDKVVYRFLPEAAVRTGALSSGQVDLIEGVQPTDVSAFEHVDGFQFLTGPSAATTSFTLNVNYTAWPANDPRVRRALRDGFDLDGIVKSIYLGTVRRAWSNVGPDNPDYASSLTGSWGNKIADANHLLDEAGWTTRDQDGFRTKDGKRLLMEVGYPQPYIRDGRDVLIHAIQSAVRQNLGLDLRLRIITAGEFETQKASGRWTIYPNTQNASDAAFELSDNLGGGGFLYKAVSARDPILLAKVNQARQLPVGDARHKLLGEIQQYAVDQAYIVPLYAPQYHLAAKSTVHGIGFEPSLDGPASSYSIWVEKEGR
jgi:peptide/nickel transport system substrate-binding protein